MTSRSCTVSFLLVLVAGCGRKPPPPQAVTAESVQGNVTAYTTMRAPTDTVPAQPPRQIDVTNGAAPSSADADGPMTFLISGVERFLITDPSGRQLGVIPSSPARVHNIPGARLDFDQLCSDAPGEDGCTQGEWEAHFDGMTTGTYRLEVVGSGVGTFTLQVDGAGSGVARSFEFGVDAIEVPRGAEQRYELMLPPTGSGEQARFRGGFAGGHQGATGLVTYAAPTSDTTTLPSRTDSVTIILFEVPVEMLSPVEMQWNDGENLSYSIPRPAPLRIRYPVRSGVNRLIVGASGRDRGKPLWQTDTLVYLAP